MGSMSERADHHPEWSFDAELLRRIEAEPLPEVPIGLLSRGLDAIALARTSATFPARLAAAAAGADLTEVRSTGTATHGLSARWERGADGTLSVTVSSNEPHYRGLVEIGWRAGEGSEVERLMTPLAEADSGAFVRYEVIASGSGAVAIEVGPPTPVPTVNADEAAVRRAFEGRPRGVVVRAWREFLAVGSPTAPVAELVGSLLGSFER